MLGALLDKAISESSHPDVRDRALLYYRLLEHSPEECRRVVCAPKEVVDEFQEELDDDAKDRIYEEFNTLSTVYRQPAQKFIVGKASLGVYRMQPPPSAAQAFDGPMPRKDVASRNSAPEARRPTGPAEFDFLDEGPGPNVAIPAARPGQSGTSDLLGMSDLLGSSDIFDQIPSAPLASSFSLATGAVMDGAVFQARWAQLPQQPLQQKQMRPLGQTPPSTPAAVEEMLRRVGIQVIASGTIPPGQSMKFYFYARQATGPPGASQGEIWFMTELILAPGSSAQASHKAVNAQPASMAAYSALLWEVLQAYVHP